ncbi:50S ribosomal protein L30 [Actinomycetaceae bacterium MB13-C1-2]|nr:50S ribosomal protein L30 [Actinomycetaceae bacterium MB13-C1-2]
MAKLKITLTKSIYGQKRNIAESVRSLGLRKIGQSTVREDTPVVLGQVHTAKHLLDVEEVD